MKTWQKLGLGLLVLVALLTASLTSVWGGSSNTSDFASGQILVKFRPGTAASEIAKIHKQNNTFVKGEIKALGVQVVNVPRGKEKAKVTAYVKNPNVEFAELDFMAKALGIPNDPYFDTQWGMDAVDAPEAWNTTIGSSTVKIAILDTGIDQDHEDLKSKIVVVDNVNFTNSDTVDDRYGHGTHVAGIAAADTNNSVGVAGVGYQSSLVNVKVLGDDAWGTYSWVANGIVWATNNGARVINMSLGGGQRSKTLENAVNYAWSNGVVLVAAAGNSNNPSPTYPAKYEKCIAVAATDDRDLKADFSSYGDWVDVAAPGVSVFSTWNDDDSPLDPQPVCEETGFCYKYGSGTSMSTPHVAGLAGLLWATGHGENNRTVRDRIEKLADPITGTGDYWTWGRINAARAVGDGVIEEPTPEPLETMHVSDITMWSERKGSSYSIYTRVSVVDENNVAVSEATVYLTTTLPDGSSESNSRNTGGNGEVVFKVRARQTGTYISTVNNVVREDWTYDPSGNLETNETLTVE